VQFAVEWAKNKGFRKCYVHADENNMQACRVYEKAGMTFSNVKEFSIIFFEDE
jgi:RimJ/RimL family protein N-acetyltransferase